MTLRDVPAGVVGTYVRMIAQRPCIRSYPVLPGPGFRLVRRFDSEADHWVIYDEPSGVFGSGATIADALADFEQAAREHLEVLEGTDDLSGDLEEQRSYLRERLR